MRWLFLLLLCASAAWAHDFWLQPKGGGALLIYGHVDDQSPYDRSQVKKALGLNAQGQPVAVKLNADGSLTPQSEAAQLAVEIDTGFWSKTAMGWQNKSRREATNAFQSEWSLYYSKLLVKPAACLNRPFGQRLEIVPVAVKPGEVRVKVLLNGKPVPDQKLFVNHERKGQTDQEGEATVVCDGLTTVSASFKEPLADNPDAERLNLNAVLTVP